MLSIHQKILRVAIVAIFGFVTVLCTAQEDCANGVDDDGDSLVDLNDPDCSCFEVSADSLIADFEERTCCPSSFTGLGNGAECLVNWSPASDATPDYLNVCDFIGGVVIP